MREVEKSKRVVYKQTKTRTYTLLNVSHVKRVEVENKKEKYKAGLVAWGRRDTMG